MESDDILARLEAIESRLDRLEESPTPPAAADSGFWLLDGLDTQGEIPGGSVAFGGTVDSDEGALSYQWHRPASFLVDEAWDASFARLEALAHPARGAILKFLLRKPATVAELVEKEIVSSPGSAYHHLAALSAEGWVAKSGDGTYRVRDSRVIALLTIVAAGEDH